MEWFKIDGDVKALLLVMCILILPMFVGLALEQYNKEVTKRECYAAAVSIAKEAQKYDEPKIILKCD